MATLQEEEEEEENEKDKEKKEEGDEMKEKEKEEEVLTKEKIYIKKRETRKYLKPESRQ